MSGNDVLGIVSIVFLVAYWGVKILKWAIGKRMSGKKYHIEPFEDINLGITFPVSLGKLKKMENVFKYDTEGLGYSLKYSTGNGQIFNGDMVCDIYIYTLNCKELKSGVDKYVIEHFQTVLRDISVVNHVVRAREINGDFQFEKTGLAAKWALIDVYNVRISHGVFSTFVLLTSYRGHFIKIRCSCPLYDGPDLPPQIFELLAELDELFQRSVV